MSADSVNYPAELSLLTKARSKKVVLPIGHYEMIVLKMSYKVILVDIKIATNNKMPRVAQAHVPE